MEQSFKQIAELFQIVSPKLSEEEIEIARSKKGHNAEESDLLGIQSLNDGDYQTAIEHFKAAMQQRGAGDTQSQLHLAGALEYADQAPQALRQYERALQIKQQEPEPWVGISEIYKRHGRYREAVEQLGNAIRCDAENSYLYMKLAETFYQMGEKTKALDAVQRAVASAPTEAFYHYWMGDLLMEMKRYEEALQAQQAAIEMSPGDAHYYIRAMVAFWNSGRQQEALKALRLASELRPDENVYHGLLEELLSEMGMLDEAAMEADRANQMDQYDQDQLRRLLEEMNL